MILDITGISYIQCDVKIQCTIVKIVYRHHHHHHRHRHHRRRRRHHHYKLNLSVIIF